MMQRNQSKSAMWGRIFLTGCAMILSASLAFAGSHKKLSKDLEGAKVSSQVDVIVQYTQVPTARHHQKVLSRGGKIKRELGRFKGGAYTISASKLADLAADPEVVYISPDRPLHNASTAGSLDYHTGTINAPAAWAQGLNGTGIGVAVIDSGIAPNSDLNPNNVVYSQDFTGLGSAVDQYGHGTHVSGIIAGDGASSTGSNDFYTFQGVAQNASLINLRVLDQNGNGTDSEVIAAIQTAIQLKNTYNIRVINLSLGRPVWESYTQDPLCQAVEQAWQAGIVVVVAAGNFGRDNLAGTNGYGTITAPGNDPYVITVGAMNTEGTADRTDDVPASYSSKGPSLFDQIVKPDLVAPGNAIISLYTPGDALDQAAPSNEIPLSAYQTNGSNASSSTYFSLSGTSMAAPQVTGAAALLLQQNPSLTPDQIKARLMLTAFKGLVQESTATDAATGTSYNEQADVFTVGAGYLDIQAALASTATAPATTGSALSPIAALATNGDVVMLQNGSSVLAGDALGGGGCGTDCIVLWGTGSVYGDGIVLWGTNLGGGDIVLWGTNSTTSDIVLWGTGSVADDIVLWGTQSANADGEIVLWGTSTTMSDAAIVLWGTDLTSGDIVLWGTGSSDKDGVILWGTSGTFSDK